MALILFDSLGWRNFATSGHPIYQTPNIDALALVGARFTQACTSCSPSAPQRLSPLSAIAPPHSAIGGSAAITAAPTTSSPPSQPAPQCSSSSMPTMGLPRNALLYPLPDQPPP
ncbi:MAG: sulfatase-like hydrolase/transferase [Bryobacter sp.]|nr:sulfatase-like hydrolase/transferase [Bryobacter sp. CoA8 C33]